jgi:hypothetical protein
VAADCERGAESTCILDSTGVITPVLGRLVATPNVP